MSSDTESNDLSSWEARKPTVNVNVVNVTVGAAPEDYPATVAAGLWLLAKLIHWINSKTFCMKHLDSQIYKHKAWLYFI